MPTWIALKLRMRMAQWEFNERIRSFNCCGGPMAYTCYRTRSGLKVEVRTLSMM